MKKVILTVIILLGVLCLCNASAGIGCFLNLSQFVFQRKEMPMADKRKKFSPEKRSGFFACI